MIKPNKKKKSLYTQKRRNIDNFKLRKLSPLCSSLINIS